METFTIITVIAIILFARLAVRLFLAYSQARKENKSTKDEE